MKTVTIYKTPNCQACRRTSIEIDMKAKDVKVTEVLLDHFSNDPVVIEEVKQISEKLHEQYEFSSAPLVVIEKVFENGQKELVTYWAGLKPDMIKEHIINCSKDFVA